MTADIEADLDKIKTKKIAERVAERAERQELFEKLFDTYSDEIFGDERPGAWEYPDWCESCFGKEGPEEEVSAAEESDSTEAPEVEAQV